MTQLAEWSMVQIQPSEINLLLPVEKTKVNKKRLGTSLLKKHVLGCGDGQEVSVLAFYSVDPSLNHADSVKNCLKRTNINEKEAHFLKKHVFGRTLTCVNCQYDIDHLFSNLIIFPFADHQQAKRRSSANCHSSSRHLVKCRVRTAPKIV